MPKKQKSGLYRSKVKIGVDADGKPLYKYISGRTQKELAKAKSEAEEYYIAGTGLRPDRLFGEYATNWYKVHKAPFIAPASQRGYRSMLNRYVLPAFASRNMRAIFASDLQAFLNSFAGRSGTMITLALAVLHGVFGMAYQDRILPADPSRGLRRPDAEPPAEKRALTDEERARMVALFPAHPLGLYLAAMYYTGVRPGECMGLQWGDFDFGADMLHVQRDVDYATPADPIGDLKTQAADRYVPIPAELRALLWPRRGLPNAYLFALPDGKLPTQYEADKMWVTLMDAAGMTRPAPEPTGKRKRRYYGLRAAVKPIITPHCMRHNYITMCWENGVDVMLTMKMVGHKDAKTTLNIYTHLSRAQLEGAQGKLDGMFEKKVAKKLHSGNRKK